MDWVVQGNTLPRVNVRGCLSHAFSEIQAHIDRFGADDPLPTDPRYRSNIFLNVRFGISRTEDSPSRSVLTYGDALLILEAMWLKGNLEGWRGCVVNILDKKSEEVVGVAILWNWPRVGRLGLSSTVLGNDRLRTLENA